MQPLTDIDEANSKISELHAEIERLRAQLARMQRHIFGRRRESIDPNQLLLFESGKAALELLEREAKAAKLAPPVPELKKKGHGRKPFADHLPREEIGVDLPEAERCCPDCGEAMKFIGNEVSERGHFIPAKIVVNRYVRGKYACPRGHTVKCAPMPQGVIDKGKYEASVYAHVVTSKYSDHLPLNRLQGIFRRHGAEISKQSMWDMLVRFDELAAQPVLKEMHRQILQEGALQADETTIKVRNEQGRGTRRGVLWVWRNVRGSPDQKVVAEFKDDRSAKGPDAFLGTWSGTLLTDGYDGVNPVATRNNITRAGCWAHARRKFRDAMEAGARKAAAVLRQVQRLFWIERAIIGRATRRGFDLDQLVELREDVRNRRSRGVLRKLYDLVFALDEDPATQANDSLRKAVTYAIKQRMPLLAHLEDGRIPIHNNDTERDLRHVVTGRKNWLTFASERGGRVAGRLYSLVMSAKLARINVEEYLEDLLNRVSTTPMSRIAELTPWAWAQSRAGVATQPS